jgi:hypothetical protein
MGRENTTVHVRREHQRHSFVDKVTGILDCMAEREKEENKKKRGTRVPEGVVCCSSKADDDSS